MGKAIQFTRNELVWETYEVCWDESDWANTLKWLAEKTDDYYKQIYALVKDLSWDEIVAEYKRWNGENEEECLYYVFHTSRSYNGEESVWKEPLWDVIREWMQEDMWDKGPEYSDYADDYNEEFEIIENDR